MNDFRKLLQQTPLRLRLESDALVVALMDPNGRSAIVQAHLSELASEWRSNPETQQSFAFAEAWELMIGLED